MAVVVLGTLLVLAAAQASQSGVEAKAPVDIVNIVGKVFLDNELNFINWCVSVYRKAQADYKTLRCAHGDLKFSYSPNLGINE